MSIRSTPSRPRGRTARSLLLASATCALVLSVTAPATAVPADAGSPGLFGVQDPTYDGVYRQSLAIMAFDALDESPPESAVEWLLDQQCANGGWQAYRADTDTECASSDITTYSGPDSNSTALAIQALLTVGELDTAAAGLDFLEGLQQPDGGIAYLQGADSDTNSTALTAAAVSAFGLELDDAESSAGKSLRDGLAGAQIWCEGAPADRGGYRFQSTDDPYGNDYASVQAVLGASGSGLPVASTGSDDDQAAPTCPQATEPTDDDRLSAGAWYLTQRLAAGSGTIEYSPGSTDWSSTRFAVIGLAASGHGRSAIGTALTALAGSVSSTVTDDEGDDRAGVLAELILANEAGRSALASTAAARATVRRSTPASSAPKPVASSPAASTPVSPSPSAPPVDPTTSPAPDLTATTTPAATTAAPTAPAPATTAPATSAPTTPAPTSAARGALAEGPVRQPVNGLADSATIDSQALLARLEATLQQAAAPTTTPAPTTPASTSPTAVAGGDTDDGEVSGADLARTGSDLPLARSLTVAALLVLTGSGLMAITSRRTRRSH